MNWITLTEESLAKYQAGGYVDAFKNAALMAGQENPVPSSIRSTVLKIRGAIKSGGYAVDSDQDKIPAELENDALALVVALCKPRIDTELSTDERDAVQRATNLLYKIAEGKFDVSRPDNPEPSATSTQSNGGCALVRPGRGVPQRTDFNGL